MKKALAIVLVLMLVLVPVTAMAEQGVSEENAGFNSNSASTDFMVEVNTTNINATVPLNLVFVANASGGVLTMPNGYSIKNNSALALKVTRIVTNTLQKPSNATTDPTFATASQTNASTINNVFQMTINGQDLTEGMNQELSTPVWNIDAKTEAGAGTLDLLLAGSCSPLDFTTESAGVALFKVTYTIAVG